MYFYRYHDRTMFSMSPQEQAGLTSISEEEAARDQGIIYFIKPLPPAASRRSYAVTHSGQLNLPQEDLRLLQLGEENEVICPQWLLKKMAQGQVTGLNTAYDNWQEGLSRSLPGKWRINVAGLGDVGGTLLMGLRLMGADSIEALGIYDRDENKLKRWEFELNQINGPGPVPMPPVHILREEEVFDCDLFAFCIAARVPALGEEKVDVRMVQLEENAKIINLYGTMARERHFKGIFAVVSDPVDLLCKSVFLASNRNVSGHWDGRGLVPEQIRGYGLGVMHARALYYAGRHAEMSHYISEGRAFGPHGADLVIADSIENYNESLSLILTEKARTANLAVRKTGFKPYIAPALSSGALSILATIRGEWHYSATFMGGVYMGAKNRLRAAGTELEQLRLPAPLVGRLQNTYDRLEALL